MMVNRFILAADEVRRALEFAHLPEGWAAVAGVVVFIVLLYAVILLYQREQRAGASVRTRRFLAGLRCAVIVVLAVIWLQPILATYIDRKDESFTLLLADGSASMSLRDRYPDPEDAERVTAAVKHVEASDVSRLTRAQVAHAVLTRDNSSLLKRLAARNTVRMYQFGDGLHAVGECVADGGMRQAAGAQEARGEPEGDGRSAEGTSASSRPADAVGAAVPTVAGDSMLGVLANADLPATDIGRAVRTAVESQQGSPVAAVIVLSDGRFNRGEPAEVIARFARSRKIPVFTVGIGDPAPPRNLAITAVEAPPSVFVKDPFKVTVRLRAQGLNDSRVTVELRQRTEGQENTTVVEAKTAVVDAAGRIEPVVFNHQIGEASEMHLQVQAVPVEGETLTDDNLKECTVRALDNKMRVLLVAGAPNWEYRYLSRLLERDATVDVSCWLQSADPDAVRDGNTVITEFPRAEAELFKYDCIILLDPQPVDVDAAWVEHVETLVGNHGGGLLYAAGRKNTSRFAHDPNTRPLIELLPVVIDAGESDLLINELGHFQTSAWPFSIPAEAAGHPVLAMSDQPGETMQIWAQLPGVYWHYPVRREKPVASVLLRHSNPRMRNAYGGHVLLATQFLGTGRTGFVAFDGTWRWRRFGDVPFNRFWIQLVRHMVEGKLLGSRKRGLIQMERDTYTVGEAVLLEARLLDAQYLPLQRETVDATARVEGQPDRPLALTAQPGRPGWYRGQFVPEMTGAHTVRVELAGGNGEPPATIAAEVRVGRPDLEFRNTELDRESLELLASQSAGGRYLDIDEVGQLPDLVPSRTATLVLTGQPITLWDRWGVLVLLVALLGVEWSVRKRSRLL